MVKEESHIDSREIMGNLDLSTELVLAFPQFAVFDAAVVGYLRRGAVRVDCADRRWSHQLRETSTTSRQVPFHHGISKTIL